MFSKLFGNSFKRETLTAKKAIFKPLSLPETNLTLFINKKQLEITKLTESNLCPNRKFNLLSPRLNILSRKSNLLYNITKKNPIKSKQFYNKQIPSLSTIYSRTRRESNKSLPDLSKVTLSCNNSQKAKNTGRTHTHSSNKKSSLDDTATSTNYCTENKSGRTATNRVRTVSYFSPEKLIERRNSQNSLLSSPLTKSTEKDSLIRRRNKREKTRHTLLTLEQHAQLLEAALKADKMLSYERFVTKKNLINQKTDEIDKVANNMRYFIKSEIKHQKIQGEKYNQKALVMYELKKKLKKIHKLSEEVAKDQKYFFLDSMKESKSQRQLCLSERKSASMQKYILSLEKPKSKFRMNIEN